MSAGALQLRGPTSKGKGGEGKGPTSKGGGGKGEEGKGGRGLPYHFSGASAAYVDCCCLKRMKLVNNCVGRC